MARLLDL